MAASATSKVPECTLQWAPMPRDEILRAEHFISSRAYSAYDGVDLLPTLQSGRCDVAGTDGIWRTQRLGPLHSTGGYDWFNFIGYNLLGIDSLLQAKSPTQVGIAGHRVLPIDSAGNILVLPPVHLHHFHLNPCHDCWLPPTIRLIEYHGDWQDAKHPTRLFEQMYDGVKFLRPAKILKEFGAPEEDVVGTSFDFQLNDVRPVNSSLMTWFMSASVLLTKDDADSSRRAVSFHTISGPGRLCPDRECKALPFFVPSTTDSVVFYLGSMPFAGRLSDMVYHAHQSALQAALLFAGPPSDFPILDTLKEVSDHVGLVVTSKTMYRTNSELKASLIREHPRSLVCEAVGNRECIGDECFDRAAKLSCSGWQFEQGSPFTCVSFHGQPLVGSPGPGPVVMMHSIWFMAYIADDRQSHYSRSLCLRDGVSITCPVHKLQRDEEVLSDNTAYFGTLGVVLAVAFAASRFGPERFTQERIPRILM